jgi:hypothetical protein
MVEAGRKTGTSKPPTAGFRLKYEKPLAKETLAGGFFILPAKSGASPKTIYA